MSDDGVTPADNSRVSHEVQHRAVLEAEAPVLADLRAAGLSIDSVSDLINEDIDYRDQLSLIVDWIPRCDNLRVREMLVRALAIPAARKTAASQTLLREFKEVPRPNYRWAVGLALTGAARPQDADEVVALFKDDRYGYARQELARVIARLRPPTALEVLVEALDDEDVAGHAVEALGFLGNPRAIPHLELMKAHPKPWVRKAATSAIAKIEKRRAST